MLTLLKSCTYADSMASAKSSGVQMSSAKYADKFAARSRLTAPRIGLYPLLFTFFQGRTGETGSHRTAHTASQSGLWGLCSARKNLCDVPAVTETMASLC